MNVHISAAIRNDTLFFKEGTAGILVKATRRYLSGDYTLEIKYLPNGEKATYVSK